MLTSLSPFGDMWVTSQEWEEEGKKIIHKKALLCGVCCKQRSVVRGVACLPQTGVL